MTELERRDFLGWGTRTGKLATAGAGGRAHVAPIWFELDRDVLVFTTGAFSVKGRNLRRDPRCALCVDDETPPFAYVIIEGIVELSEDPDELLRWATLIAARYMGKDLAERYGRRNAVAGELLVRLTPSKLIARKGIAD